MTSDLEKILGSREKRKELLKDITDYAYFGAVGELIKNLEKKGDKDSVKDVTFLADRAEELRTITKLAIKKIDDLDKS